jgi:hypothetical protein
MHLPHLAQADACSDTWRHADAVRRYHYGWMHAMLSAVTDVIRIHPGPDPGLILDPFQAPVEWSCRESLEEFRAAAWAGLLTKSTRRFHRMWWQGAAQDPVHCIQPPEIMARSVPDETAPAKAAAAIAWWRGPGRNSFGRGRWSQKRRWYRQRRRSPVRPVSVERVPGGRGAQERMWLLDLGPGLSQGVRLP